MQRNRGNGDPFFDFGDPFAGFGDLGGGLGDQRSSMLSNFSGGRGLFDDPFFQRPFGSMFGPSMFNPMGNPFNGGPTSGLLEQRMPQPTNPRGLIIEELNSDDDEEKEEKEKRDNPRKHGRSSDGPYVEDPDEAVEGRSKQLQFMNNFNRVNNTHSQPHTHSYNFQSSTVTYGGVDGAYYTSSRTRRTGSDGLTFEEAKEADTTSGQASHLISLGIHDKGHTVDRKLNSDGRVDTMQMLQNLNEDELSGFNEAWNGNASKHLPCLNQGFNGGMGQMGAGVGGERALPSTEPIRHSGNTRRNINEQSGNLRPQQHSRKTKSGLGDGATSSRGKGGAPY